MLATLHVAACVCKGIVGFGGALVSNPHCGVDALHAVHRACSLQHSRWLRAYCMSRWARSDRVFLCLTGLELREAYARFSWREKHAWGQAEGMHVLDCPMETGTEVLNSDQCCASAVRDLQCTV